MSDDIPVIFGDDTPVIAAQFRPLLSAGWATSVVPVLAQLILVPGLLARVWMQAEKQRLKAV